MIKQLKTWFKARKKSYHLSRARTLSIEALFHWNQVESKTEYVFICEESNKYIEMGKRHV